MPWTLQNTALIIFKYHTEHTSHMMALLAPVSSFTEWMNSATGMSLLSTRGAQYRIPPRQ